MLAVVIALEAACRGGRVRVGWVVAAAAALSRC
jgi:hypothetical protein